MATETSRPSFDQVDTEPAVQSVLSNGEPSQNLENIPLPYVMKEKTLMSPGVWNGYYYSTDSIKEAYNSSDWEQKEVRSLFLDHQDERSKEWVGEVRNVKLKGDEVIGDLVFVDKPTAIKLAYGAKMGISPKVYGQEEGGKMMNFKFSNFSVVINPAVKTAYINNSQKKEVEAKMTQSEISVQDLYGFVASVMEGLGTEEVAKALEGGKFKGVSLKELAEFCADTLGKKPGEVLKAFSRMRGEEKMSEEENKEQSTKNEEQEQKQDAGETQEQQKQENSGQEEGQEQTEQGDQSESQGDESQSSEEDKSSENSETDELMQALGEVEESVKKSGIQKLSERAKKIMRDDSSVSSWKDAVKEASKQLEEESKQQEEQQKYPFKFKSISELSSEELTQSITALSSELAKKKGEKEYPYPEEESSKNSEEKEEQGTKVKEMEQKIQEKDKSIKELSEKLDKVEQKLNEPAKKSVKSQELGQDQGNQDPDQGMLNFLQSLGN